MMLEKLLDVFRGKERKKRKMAIEKIQYLNRRIPLITIEEEKHNFEQEKQKIHDTVYSNVPIEEVTENINDLIAKVESYIRVQEDEDYRRIIEHRTAKNISSVAEIKEICDPLDKGIVYKYVQIEMKKKKVDRLQIINKELLFADEVIQRMRDIISQKKDAEELASIWSYILQQEQDTFEGLKNRVSNPKMNELGVIEDDISFFRDRFTCLEKYGKDYLSEHALGSITNEVKDYMPRDDISYEEIYRGLGDSIVTELKDCIGRENEGKMIKDRMAKLIYSRLKKGMFVR
jgi:hypothetical protein